MMRCVANDVVASRRARFRCARGRLRRPTGVLLPGLDLEQAIFRARRCNQYSLIANDAILLHLFIATMPDIAALHGASGKDSTCQHEQDAALCSAVRRSSCIGLAALLLPTFHLMRERHLNLTMPVRWSTTMTLRHRTSLRGLRQQHYGVRSEAFFLTM